MQLFQVVRAHASYEKLNFILSKHLILGECFLDRDSRPHMVDDTTDSVDYLRSFTNPTAGEELLNNPHSGVHGRSVTGLAIPLINGAKHQFLMRVDTFAQLFIIRAIESLNVNAQGGRFAVLS